MNHSFEVGELNQMAGIVGQPGWGLLKRVFIQRLEAEDHVNRVTGDAFNDGQLRGSVERMKEIVRFMHDTEKRVEEQDKGEDKDV